MNFFKASFISLLLVTSVEQNFAQPSPAAALRFSLADGTRFKKEASAALKSLALLIGRGIEVANQARSPVLGASDRNFLNSEWTQLRSEFERELTQTVFVDSFGEATLYLRDGIDFMTVVGKSLPQQITIAPMADIPDTLTSTTLQTQSSAEKALNPMAMAMHRVRSSNADLASVGSGLHPELKDAFAALYSATQEFAYAKDLRTHTVESSNAQVATGSATVDASPQTVSFQVSALASSEVWQVSTSGLDNEVTSVDGQLRILIRGQVDNVDVPAHTTLRKLNALINDSTLLLRSTLYDTGEASPTPVRLILTDMQVGAAPHGDSNLEITSTLTNLPAEAFAKVVTAHDAKILVGPHHEEVSSSTNDISKVFPEITLHLVSVSDAPVTFNVTESTSAGVEKIKAFIAAYNLLIYQAQSLYEKTGDPRLNFLGIDLLERITYTADGDTRILRGLIDLGIFTHFDMDDPDQNGRLQMDEQKLQANLVNDFSEVVDFFQGTRNPATGEALIYGFSELFSSDLDELKQLYTQTY